jgi:DNA-binding response OmpR family regulator
VKQGPPVRTDSASDTSRRLMLVGFDPTHARLLAKALAPAFSTQTVEWDRLEQPGRDQRLASETIIVVTTSDPLAVGHLEDRLLRLRRQSFVWNPVLAIVPKAGLPANPKSHAATEALWFAAHPVDRATATQLVGELSPLQKGRRLEIVRSAVLNLRSDLRSLLRAASERKRQTAASLKSAILDSADLAAKHRGAADDDVNAFQGLASEVAGHATIQPEELGQLATLASRAEGMLRDAGANAAFQVSLHRLCNQLRFAEYATGPDRTALAESCRILENLPDDEMRVTHTDLPRIISDLRTALGHPLASACSDADSKEVQRKLRTAVTTAKDQIASLDEICKSLLPISPVQREQGGYQRILIVEDEATWRGAVSSVASELAGNREVISESCASRAIALLGSDAPPTLALVDLGIPQTERDLAAGRIDLDGGLNLIRTVTSQTARHGFIILTAVENYSAAVRTALAAGVTPQDYVQKLPREWEQQLRSRIELALAPLRRRLPLVEVLPSTGRLIRVNGIEVQLDRKPFVFLSYLADHARRWRPLEMIRVSLTTPGLYDITPPVSDDIAEECERGEGIYPEPASLLTTKHLNEYVAAIEIAVAEAFRAAAAGSAPVLIAYDADRASYRLEGETGVVSDERITRKTDDRMSVLVIEDDPDWAESIEEELVQGGFVVRRAATVEEALAALESPPHAVSLDLQLPQNADDLSAKRFSAEHGVSLLRHLRDHYPEVGVAVLTTLEWNDTLLLRLVREGVHFQDYISKHWPEPTARLSWSLWRLATGTMRGSMIPPASEPAGFHRIEASQQDAHLFWIDGHLLKLTPRPARVFGHLVRRLNTPVDRNELIDAAWPPEKADELPDYAEDTLNTIVARLRAAISKATSKKIDPKEVLIATRGTYEVRGIFGGYRSASEASTESEA